LQATVWIGFLARGSLFCLVSWLGTSGRWLGWLVGVVAVQCGGGGRGDRSV